MVWNIQSSLPSLHYSVKLNFRTHSIIIPTKKRDQWHPITVFFFGLIFYSESKPVLISYRQHNEFDHKKELDYKVKAYCKIKDSFTSNLMRNPKIEKQLRERFSGWLGLEPYVT